MAVKVEFNEQVIYRDAEYTMVFMIVNAEAQVTRDGYDENDEQIAPMAKSGIQTGIMREMSNLEREGVSCKELTNQIPRINEGVSALLAKDGFNVVSFNVISIEPTPDAQEMINMRDRTKSVAQMGPEEMARMQQEAMAQAAAQQAAPAGAAPAAASNYPKFCPECGTPTTGSNFCPNCGNKLRV